MKVVAVGKKESLLGLMLAGIKERFEAENPEEALQFLRDLEKQDSAFFVVVESSLYRMIEGEIVEIQARKPSFVFYELSGGSLNWRKE